MMTYPKEEVTQHNFSRLLMQVWLDPRSLILNSIEPLMKSGGRPGGELIVSDGYADRVRI